MNISRLSKNITYNLLGQGFTLVLGFVSVKEVFQRLGEDALGIIYFTGMMNFVLRIVLNMGICRTTVREISTHLESEPEYIKKLIRTFSLFYWGAYALAGVTVVFLAPVLVQNWINLKTMDPSTATYVLRILGIASLLALPISFYGSLFSGLQRMEFSNSIAVTVESLRRFGTILILVLGGNLFNVVHWYVACYGLKLFAYLIASSHFFPIWALVPGYSAEVVRRNVGFALKMMSISITTAIHTQADKLVLSKLMPIGVLGYYSVAYRNTSKARQFMSAVSQAAFPSFSAIFKAGDRNGLMSQYRKLQDLLCFGIVPVFAAIPYAVLPLFSYILNEEAAHLLLLPTTLLCMGFYMNGTMTIPYAFSFAVGKPGIAARLNFYALFVVLPVTALLVYYLGLTGAGLSWIFYQVFAYSYFVPRMCRECTKMPVWDWYIQILKVLTLVGSTYGSAWIMLGMIDNHSILFLALAYAGASVVFLTTSYFLISDELRDELRGILSRIFNHSKTLLKFNGRAIR